MSVQSQLDGSVGEGWTMACHRLWHAIVHPSLHLLPQIFQPQLYFTLTVKDQNLKRRVNRKGKEDQFQFLPPSNENNNMKTRQLHSSKFTNVEVSVYNYLKVSCLIPNFFRRILLQCVGWQQEDHSGILYSKLFF